MPDLYKTYDDETLKKIQHLELGILRDFDALCEKNGISYFICGGTAIGAARHHGFIPWDDDIDVGLLRADYEKFLTCAVQQLAEKYDILNTRTDHNYPLMSTRMVLRGTRFREECFKDLTCNFGIFLDIYCFDYIPDDEREMRRVAKSVWLKGKLMILSTISDPVLYYGGFKAKLVRFGCAAMHKVLSWLRIDPWFFCRRIEKQLQAHGQESSRIAYQFDPKLYTSVIPVDTVIPVKKTQFEDLQVCCPAKMEVYLQQRYGDYMTLPPEDKRHNHPPYDLDFGKY